VFVKVTGKEATFRFLVISGGAELTLGGVKRRLAQQKSKDLNFGGSRIDDL
jgi:hypothetical protein